MAETTKPVTWMQRMKIRDALKRRSEMRLELLVLRTVFSSVDMTAFESVVNEELLALDSMTRNWWTKPCNCRGQWN